MWWVALFVYVAGLVAIFVWSALYEKKRPTNYIEPAAVIAGIFAASLWPMIFPVIFCCLVVYAAIYPIRFIWCKLAGRKTPGLTFD